MKNIQTLKQIAQENYSDSIRNIYLNNDFLKFYSVPQFPFENTEKEIVMNEMSDLQKKIVFYAISSIKNEDRDLTLSQLAEKKFILKVDTFLKLMGLNRGGINQQRVKKEILNLMKNPIQIKTKFSTEYITWFDSIKFTSSNEIRDSFKKHLENDVNLKGELFDSEGKEIKQTNSYIVFRFGYTMSEILLNLNTYTKYNFLITYSLKNKYAVRIYEMLQTRKDTNCLTINLEDFQNSLNLTENYRKKDQFEHKIMKKAIAELKEKLNINLTYNYTTGGYNNKSAIILKADKNDDDLCKLIFDNYQQTTQKEQVKEITQAQASKTSEEDLMKGII